MSDSVQPPRSCLQIPARRSASHAGRIDMAPRFAAAALALACACKTAGMQEGTQDRGTGSASASGQAAIVEENARQMLAQGREVFRDDTFGSEDFFGGSLGLHRAIAGQKNGGVGGGVSPKTALSVGLKVDAERMPAPVASGIKSGAVSLDDPANTLALLKANAVVGVKGIFQGDRLTSLGITCAFCHSTVDDSFAAGIGRRLDGWPNRDLNVGAIVSLSPDLSAFTKLLGVDEPTVRKVLASWGPGKFDAELNLDGKAFRPDGKAAATLLPAAFGLAGVNLHTYSGWGSVTYWNAYVANNEMYGKGFFFDPRLDDREKFPVAARARFGHRQSPGDDRITSKLAALHFYQLAIPAPSRPAAVHGTRLEHAPGIGDRRGRFPVSALARRPLPHHTVAWPLHAQEGRLLPRRPVRRLRGGHRFTTTASCAWAWTRERRRTCRSSSSRCDGFLDHHRIVLLREDGLPVDLELVAGAQRLGQQ